MAQLHLRSEELNDVPDWNFEIYEVSAGVYKVTGKDSLGRSIEKIGVDVDALFADCKRDAILLKSKPARR